MRILPTNQSQIQQIQPNFEGYYRSKLGRCVDEFVQTKEPSLELQKELMTKVRDFIEKNTNKKIIGKGHHGVVFRIDDKYVLKMDLMGKYHQLIEPRKPVSKGFEKLKSYYGGAVVSFNRYCKILKNVSCDNEFTEAGLPSKFVKEHLTFNQSEYWNKEYLPKFSNLPQKSFNSLAKDFARLNMISDKNKFFAFDFVNPNNIVLVGKNTLRIVDSVNYSHAKANTVAGLLNLLVNEMAVGYKAPRTNETLELRCELIKKIFMAGEKYNLPLISMGSDREAFYYVCREFGDFNKILKDIVSIRKNNPNKDARIQKVREYLDETFNPDNAGKSYQFY